MERKCLVFIPVGDPVGYSSGHFNRIVDYIIIPACRAADFTFVRGDINVETIKNIVDCEMVLCDLSAANPEVRYAFAIRQALNLPLALIKDKATSVDYSLSEFTISEYDESLRIDVVQHAIEGVSNTLKAASINRSEPILLKKLNIAEGGGTSYTHTSSFVYTEPVPEPTVVIPSVPLPDFVGEPLTEKDIEKLKAGDVLYHTTHGKGIITTIKIMAQDKMANIQFETGTKLLVLGTSGIFRKIIG